MWELLSGQQPIPGGWQCFIAINSFDTPITLLVAHIMPGWHEVTPGHYKFFVYISDTANPISYVLAMTGQRLKSEVNTRCIHLPG